MRNTLTPKRRSGIPRMDSPALAGFTRRTPEAARTGKPGWKNEGSTLSYLLRNAFYRTAFSLARRGAVKIIPVKEVSSFADGEVIYVPGSPRALHTPGHTPGSAAIAVEKRNALLAGDAMCTWNPYTGRVGPQIMPSALNMSSAQAIASLDCPACGHRRRIASGPRRPLHPRHPRSGPTSQSRRPPQPAEPRHRPPACTPRRVGPGRHAPAPTRMPAHPSAPATLPAYT